MARHGTSVRPEGLAGWPTRSRASSGILDSLGFLRDRAAVAWWQAGPDCHSCHLRFSNYPVIFSNGKGATRDLAYASALAEFVERLQCRVDDLFSRAGNIHRFALFEPRRARTLADIARDAPRLAAAGAGRAHAGRGGRPSLPGVFGRPGPEGGGPAG